MNRTLTLKPKAAVVAAGAINGATKQKKKKKVRHGDPTAYVGKYAIAQCLAPRKSIRFTTVHENSEAAVTEANRLSGLEGGSFLVVKIFDCVGPLAPCS